MKRLILAVGVLLFSVVPIQAQHSMPGMGAVEKIDGKKNPELIPEQTVYHLFLNHLADASGPQQDAFLVALAGLQGNDVIAAKKILADYQAKHAALVNAYNTAETDLPDPTRYPRLEADFDSLIAATRARFAKEISSDGATNFTKGAKAHTSHVTLFRSPETQARIGTKILNGDPGLVSMYCFATHYSQSYTYAVGTPTITDGNPPSITGVLYTSVSVNGNTQATCGNSPPGGNLHTPKIKNLIMPMNIGGTVPFPAVCVTCWVGDQLNEQANINFDSGGVDNLNLDTQIYCSFANGNLFDGGALDAPIEPAVTVTQSVTQNPPTLGQTSHCSCDPPNGSGPDMPVYAITKVQNYQLFWVTAGVCASDTGHQPWGCLLVGSYPVDPTKFPFFYGALLFAPFPFCTYNP